MQFNKTFNKIDNAALLKHQWWSFPQMLGCDCLSRSELLLQCSRWDLMTLLRVLRMETLTELLHARSASAINSLCQLSWAGVLSKGVNLAWLSLHLSSLLPPCYEGRQSSLLDPCPVILYFPATLTRNQVNFYSTYGAQSMLFHYNSRRVNQGILWSICL